KGGEKYLWTQWAFIPIMVPGWWVCSCFLVAAIVLEGTQKMSDRAEAFFRLFGEGAQQYIVQGACDVAVIGAWGLNGHIHMEMLHDALGISLKRWASSQ